MHTGCVDPNTAAEFLEGVLSGEIASGVEAHMARCAECRRLIGALAKATRGPDTEPEPDDALASTDVVGGARAREAPLELAEGTKVGRFLVLRRLGAGGMGVIYAAYDPHLDRKVALKFLRGEPARGSRHSEDARARLIGEAQAIARVTHPNVISVYDVGEYENEVYIAMEMVEGGTLTRWLRVQPRSWREIRRVFLEAARGLAAAHAQDLVHRDFKPENVLVGEGDRVVVMDFGLARAAAEGRDPTPRSGDAEPSALGASLTRTGAILGTPRYMAPEQFQGRTADGRSDQFSLCVALYEALYRSYPFYSETAAQLTTELPVVDQLRPLEREREVPAFLRAAILRGMSVRPDDRFDTMQAFCAAIAERASSRVRWVAAAAIVPAVVAAAFAYRSMAGQDEAEAAEKAHEEALEAERARTKAVTDELWNLRVEMDRLSRKVKDREQDRQIRFALETELEKKRARVEDIEEREARRQQAARERRVFEERLDKGLVRRYVDRRRRALAKCYEAGRELNPMLGQWVNVKFWISRDGQVLSVETSGLRDRTVGDCIKSVLGAIEFPRSHVATIANFGFEFEAGHSPMAVRDGDTEGGDEDALRLRVREDGLVCDPRDPLCGVE